MIFSKKIIYFFSGILITFSLFLGVIKISSAAGECTPDAKKDCPNQIGVCDGSQETCDDYGSWPGCDRFTYLAHNSDYEHSMEVSATDGLDNDCDGFTDLADADCWCVPSESRPCTKQGGVCAGSRVNRQADGTFPVCDAAFYHAYSVIQYGTDVYEESEANCNDNKDNDCDGHADCNDDSCSAAANCQNENCTNSADDDGDGYIDCADPDCAGRLGPAGFNCCWDGSWAPNNPISPTNAIPEMMTQDYCGTCQRCAAPIDISSTIPYDFQCRDRVSDDGVSCNGPCSHCVAAGVCEAYPSGQAGECSDPCYSCSGNINDLCSIAKICDNTIADSCCPLSCNSTNDLDCSPTCTPNGCNGDCPAGCTAAQDLDCSAVGCCGDLTCNAGECTAGCTSDCDVADCCGDFSCSSTIGEGCANCSVDCGACPPTCTPNGCNGSCPAGCGPTDDPDCSASGCCGDLTCDTGECTAGCTADCAVADCCGTEGCNNVIGEGCANCSADCGACPPTDSCADSDAGSTDYNNGGAVTGNSGGSPYTHSDSCASNILTEWGCLGISAISSTYNCATTPSWTCVSNACVAPSTYPLTVAKAGAGSGTVTSVPSGINCGADCSENYSSATSVILTASASAGSNFTGWSGGGCSGTGTCTVTMTSAQTVAATFNLTTYPLNITKAGTGSGTVTSAPTGINCGADCSENYSSAASVILTASASAGSNFTGWSGGGCSGTGTCTVIMSAAQTVTATFNSIPENCSVAGDEDADGQADCYDSDCAGLTGPAGLKCCQTVSNCLPTPGNCATSLCQTNHTCSYAATNSLCTGNCDQCNTASYNCEATPGSPCGSCAACQGSGNTFNCAIPFGDPNCSTVCTQCVLNGITSSCESILDAQDCNGINQCCDPGKACSSAAPASCISIADADWDSIADNVDVCPYDPDNDFDDDGTCAVGCNAGSSRSGTKINGWLCAASTPANGVVYDTCQGGDCSAAASCLALFGAEDYFNVYINGKLVVGNLFLPHYEAYNPKAVPIDQVLFNVSSYLVSGNNVVAIEAYDQDSAGVYRREVRGAFVSSNDPNCTSDGCALCSLLNGAFNRRTLRDVTHVQQMPLKCYKKIEGEAAFDIYPDDNQTAWRQINYTPSNALDWQESYVKSGTSATAIRDRIWRAKYAENSIWPGPIWGDYTTPASGGYTESHIFCRHEFTY